ncbi:MAG: response regulator [Anaerolineae bacterium]|nr:response regulator [Anaerolineae bacterium]
MAGHRVDLEPDGRRFPSHQLIPPDLLPERRYALLVEPLYFQTEPLGFVLFEIGPRDGAVYEVLRGHISSALKGAVLFQETRAARLAAERSDQIKTRLLANVSHELRTPLNIIIGHTQRLSVSPVTASPSLAQDLAHIQHSAEHQLRLINDLLDLSRAEINALDLYPVLLDPRPLIEEAFVALAEDVAAGGAVSWQLALPEGLPVVFADPVRLRQILLNLLSNAARFTEQGHITLGAEGKPPHLHVWVADSGMGIFPEQVERIYDPFFTHEGGRSPGGIGLGLSITKHLVALHEGTMAVESEPERGSTFHIYLPLPATPEQEELPIQPTAVLWFVSHMRTPPTAVTTFSADKQLQIRLINSQDDLEKLLTDELPAVVAWDVGNMTVKDWQLIRRLHNHPRLSQTPFILYQPEESDVAQSQALAGFTSLVVKPASSQALWAAIHPTIRPPLSGTGQASVLIVDDDPQARARAVEAVTKGLPKHVVRTAVNGAEGLATALADPPDLLILDLMMPEMDGFDVLEQLRANERTRQVPVIILSGRQLTLADVKRLEQHTAVTLHNKSILTEEEIAAFSSTAPCLMPIPCPYRPVPWSNKPSLTCIKTSPVPSHAAKLRTN